MTNEDNQRSVNIENNWKIKDLEMKLPNCEHFLQCSTLSVSDLVTLRAQVRIRSSPFKTSEFPSTKGDATYDYMSDKEPLICKKLQTGLIF